jgi:hypothetical protein
MHSLLEPSHRCPKLPAVLNCHHLLKMPFLSFNTSNQILKFRSFQVSPALHQSHSLSHLWLECLWHIRQTPFHCLPMNWLDVVYLFSPDLELAPVFRNQDCNGRFVSGSRMNGQRLFGSSRACGEPPEFVRMPPNLREIVASTMTFWFTNTKRLQKELEDQQILALM